MHASEQRNGDHRPSGARGHAPSHQSAALSAGEIAQLIGARLVGPEGVRISGFDTIEAAGPESLTFIRSEQYARAWATSRAAAAVVREGLEVPGHDPAVRALLFVTDPDLAMITLQERTAGAEPRPEPGVHPTAIMDPSAELGQGVSVGPFCQVGAGAVIGAGAVLESRVSVGPGCRVGAQSVLHANVVVRARSVIGAGCILHPGVVIGADGFGFRPSPDGRGLVKIPHAGNVEIADSVEIGANTCIDRGRFGSTSIGEGTKIDNLVQIGHNCKIGRACVICGCAGISGSVTMGDGVVVGGGVGIADNLTIGSGAQIAARSGLMHDVPANARMAGYPAMKDREYIRLLLAAKRLSQRGG
ncbi:MAG: UDP-3-O-(3-hydroxymyristoyl)glucosamine N-acyltransferase [Isosphaera sp.]|nr:UDP-3-O-(3-hydroxymyristoyl)glucosamine N-acyltransferase [Isosphaera sp.]